jgi:hypothetical protein
MPTLDAKFRAEERTKVMFQNLTDVTLGKDIVEAVYQESAAFSIES